MRSLRASLLTGICGVLAIHSARAASWGLSRTYTGNDFFSGFDWFTDADPTHGQVQYQSLGNAQAANLSVVSNGQFVMAVETAETVNSLRKSVRISSKDVYSDGIYILKATHAPLGCAVWPAFWTVTSDLPHWPVGGEIDIVENANDQYAGSLSSLHTNGDCSIPASTSAQTGTTISTDCNAHHNGNQGCGVELGSNSWGSALNAAGGGTYAMERSMGSTGNGVRVWFFPRGQEPADLADGSTSVDPSSWGQPGADMDVANQCRANFGTHKITFDITLCGDWAGNTYTAAGCTSQYSSCSDQVLNHGSSFDEAFWSVQSVRVFATGGATDNAAATSNTQGSLTSWLFSMIR